MPVICENDRHFFEFKKNIMIYSGILRIGYAKIKLCEFA